MKITDKFNGSENYFVLDGMPLEVCKISRSSRSKICKDVGYAYPNKGFPFHSSVMTLAKKIPQALH